MEGLKNKSVGDILEEINNHIFEWIGKCFNLDTSRSIFIITYLLNRTIADNYFPFISRHLEQHPELLRQSSVLDSEKIKELRTSYEKIYGVMLLQTLYFKQIGKILSKSNTDKKIDRLSFAEPFVDPFFVLNSISPEENAEHFLESMKFYDVAERFVPDLTFDSEYKKILNHKALLHIMVKTSPDFLQNAPLSEKYDYVLPSKLPESKKIYDVDDSLTISLAFWNFFNEIGVNKLGIPEVINDTIEQFAKYYAKRIPQRKVEIEKMLTCFGELINLAKGLLYAEAPLSEFRSKLKDRVGEEVALKFLEDIGYHKRFNDFYPTYEEFHPKNYLKLYHDFLQKGFYVYSGKIRTGAFLAWRSLVKYFEMLHQDKDFRKTKGQLLENWCYEKAVELGYDQVEKIVLIDKNGTPTERYEKMKAQTSTFPKESLDIPMLFPEEEYRYYREIDLGIRVGDYLLAFECKGTAAPVQESPKLSHWIQRTEEDFAWLNYKCGIIRYNLEVEGIEHPFLKGLIKVIPFQVRTEGLFSVFGDLTPSGFEGMLKDFRNKMKEGILFDHLEKITK